MDKDRDAIRRRQIVGLVRELIGKLIGNKTIEDDGAREKSSGPEIRGFGSFPVPDKPD